MPWCSRGPDDISDEPVQRGLLHVHRQGEPHQVGFDSVRDARQANDLRSRFSSLLAGPVGNSLRLIAVRTVGEVQVVRLCRAHG